MNTQLKGHQWGIGFSLLAVLMLTSCGGNKSDTPVSSTPENNTAVSQVKSSPAADSTSKKPGESGTKAAIPPEAQKLGVKPQSETNCPSDAPVKGNITKKRGNIYHLAKSPDYSKTKPDICFKDQATAEKAGFRAPK